MRLCKLRSWSWRFRPVWVDQDFLVHADHSQRSFVRTRPFRRTRCMSSAGLRSSAGIRRLAVSVSALGGILKWLCMAGEISGSERQPMTYHNYPGERPIISDKGAPASWRWQMLVQSHLRIQGITVSEYNSVGPYGPRPWTETSLTSRATNAATKRSC